MDVAGGGRVDVDVNEVGAARRVAQGETGFLHRLAQRGGGRVLPLVEVTTGLEPDAQPPMPVEHGAARAGHDRRGGDVGRVGVAAEGIGESLELGQERCLRSRLPRVAGMPAGDGGEDRRSPPIRLGQTDSASIRLASR